MEPSLYLLSAFAGTPYDWANIWLLWEPWSWDHYELIPFAVLWRRSDIGFMFSGTWTLEALYIWEPVVAKR